MSRIDKYYPVQNREGVNNFPDEVTKYFWESTEDGGDYEIIGDIIYILIGREDVDNFPELKKSQGKYFSLIETYGGYIDPLGIVDTVPSRDEEDYPTRIVIHVEDFPPH